MTLFIAMNTIKVENQEEMAKVFEHAAPHLKAFDGFLGFELWSSDEELKAVSRWETKEDFDQYINSDMFKKHHGGSEEEDVRPQAKVETFEGKQLA